MLEIKTQIKNSDIHGIGLFADQFIPKGTLIWRFTPAFDLKFTREQILDFPAELQIYIYKYSWLSKKSNLYCFCSDNAKYFNHSTNPNVVSQYQDNEDEIVTFALRNIDKGEEILDDYSTYEDHDNKNNILNKIAEKFQLKDELDPRLK